MRTAALVVLAALALASCKKEAATEAFPVKETAGGAAMIDFDSPEALFSCLAPRDWRIRPDTLLEASKGVSFGTAGASITILRYPESGPDMKDARKYAESFWQTDPQGKQPVIAEEKINGASVLRFHVEHTSLIPHTKTAMPPARVDFALVPVPGGFYAIAHRAPATSFEKTLPVFDAVVRSFKPKS